MSDNELDIRKNVDLINALNLADSIVYKTYHSYFNQMEIVACPAELRDSDLNDFVRFFKIERLVYEKNENSRDKLVSVFHSVASCGGSIIVLVDSDGEKINYYFGTKAALDAHIGQSAEILNKSLSGNFPGTKIVNVPSGTALNKLSNSVFRNHRHSEQSKQICTVTGVAGLRSREETHEKLFIQGMEKLVDSMRNETYSLLLIADPVSGKELQIIKRGYENLYSQLVPFTGSELNFGQNESTSISNSITEGLSKSINKSVTDTLTHTQGTSESHTEGMNKTKGLNVNPVGIAGLAGGAIGFAVGGPLGAVVGGVIGSALGGTVGFNSSTSETESNTYSTNKSTVQSQGNTEGTTDTTSEQTGITDTTGKGESRNVQLKFENKAVKNLLEKIDLQLKRIDGSTDTGMWNCSVYCFADNPSTCKIVASSYQALLRGENSSIETGIITEWTEANVKAILPWLEKMNHPVLLLDGNKITPSSFLSGAELAIHAGFPGRSVGGLPVLEMAPFGREVQINRTSQDVEQYGNKIALGKIYHMGKEEVLSVILDRKSLASHTFITGSTGSGKSNTVYQLLDEIRKTGAKFLVVEPAKGEYKNVFGNDEDVQVYGTNPKISPLLRINPFSFPDTILVQEHLDRLVEIFNVCWPMYAAMPAVLKDAVETSYKEAGWYLDTSECRFEPKRYPVFSDIVSNIKTIIESSEYSDENKGNYKGALITRLKSLTNGINGMIFTNDELSSEDLFEKNVIVDLSRVGSMETKALIMGLLVMKLQEHRMTSSKMNADLQHITVLEEAHNLLKRTSTEQSSESANLLGKSVEMLANAIAEMRTYGEGFIIADQAPGLLDMSVIRNTNTKIILRLPDQNDRELVGKSANLNDEQLVELARLQCGVAAVYQNDWIQPVLCKVKEYINNKTVDFMGKEDKDYRIRSELRKEFREMALNILPAEKVKEKIEGIDFEAFEKLDAETVTSLFHNNRLVFNEALKIAKNENDKLQKLTDYLREHIEPSLFCFSLKYQKHILRCIVNKNAKIDPDLWELPEYWNTYIEKLR
jgi:hypothetical protein